MAPDPVFDFGPVIYWTSPDGRQIPVMAGGADDVVSDPSAGSALDDALGDFAADPASHEETPAAPVPAKPVAEPATPVAKPATPAKGPAPWEDDLQKAGLDDPRYTDYHRDTVQPYVTQLEQRTAAFEKMFGAGDDGLQLATIGSNVLQALEDDPMGTLIDLARDLEIDPNQLAQTLGGDPNATATAPDPSATPDPADEIDPDRQFLQELRTERETTSRQQAYDSLITELKTEVDGFDETKFHVAMRASQGDPHEAWDIYSELTGAPAAPAEDPVDDPPPVMGGGVGSTTVADVREPRTLDQAFDDFFAEDRASTAKR